VFFSAHPGPARGRFSRSSRNVGRDAMDADGALDEACRPRTAKSCGPDLPTLPDAGIKPEVSSGDGG
jgi:hypothetical protein